MTNAEKTKMLLIERINSFTNEELFRFLYDSEDFYPFMGLELPELICPICTLDECACEKRSKEAGCGCFDSSKAGLAFCEEGYISFFAYEYDESEQALRDYFNNHLVDIVLDRIPEKFHRYFSLTSEQEREIDKRVREELHKKAETFIPPISNDNLPFN